ncbi:MAG: hypothetical protein ABL934_04630 [Lysobacteraceae bacterium]
MRPVLFMLPLLICLVGPAGCSKPKMPDHDDPPKPQTATAEIAPPTQLRDAMRKPIDKAEAAQDSVDAAAEAQRKAIDAATGN